MSEYIDMSDAELCDEACTVAKDTGKSPKQLVARIAELEAIVDKLPKTADGVPVVPGMVMYPKHKWHHAKCLPDNRAALYPKDESWVGAIPYDQCYSTREAAEAAQLKEQPNE